MLKSELVVMSIHYITVHLPSFAVKGFAGSEGTIDEKGSRLDCMKLSIL